MVEVSNHGGELNRKVLGFAIISEDYQENNMIAHMPRMCCWVLLGLLLWIPQQGSFAFVIENSDFEVGDLSGWTTYTTWNGGLGGAEFPACVDFDVNGDGRASKSAEFKVGLQRYEKKGGNLGGGGIFKTLELQDGIIGISIDIATTYSSPQPKDKRNLAGGLFEMLLDGTVIASHDFGPILNGDTQRFTLEGTSMVYAGRHEVRLRIRRPFRSLPRDTAPRQYLDNLQLTFLPE